MKKSLSFILTSLFLVGVTSIASAEIGNTPSATTDKTALDQNSQKLAAQRKVKEALAKKSPDEIRAFTEQVERDKAIFQEKYLAVPVGEREKMAREFSDKIRAGRAAVERELQKMEPDPKEKVLRDFQEKLKEDRKQLADKLKMMKVGPKEQRMAEYDKKIEAERKALIEKMDKLPLDKREQMYKAFKEAQDKKVKAFYGV